MHKILFWSGFGLAVRLWATGIQMRSFWSREMLMAYPVFAGIGAGFGYWMEGVDQRQTKMLADRRDRLLEKRARRQEREKEELAKAQAEETGENLAVSS